MKRFLVLALLAPLSFAQDAPWPTGKWATATPEERGLDPEPLAALRAKAEAGDYGKVDRIVIVHGGYIVLRAAFEHDYEELSKGFADDPKRALSNGGVPGEYNYYDPATHPFHGGTEVHSLQSVTKSVSSTLIGIAIARGEISGLDANLLSFFEAYDTSNCDPRLKGATLEHLLTMRTGIEWHETDRPLDETNTTLQLERSEDWIQFTLDQPMDAAPGERWVYNSGGSQLMSGVVRAATGEFIDAYAKTHLFGPLGITAFHWKKTPKGYPDTEGGLFLAAEDLAKFGYLFLRGGEWGGQQIVPKEWVEAATAEHVTDAGVRGRGYGYQWWRLDRGETPVWAGLGFGGQFLLVLPEQDLVGVANSWNLFGRSRYIQGPLLDAMLGAAKGLEQK